MSHELVEVPQPDMLTEDVKPMLSSDEEMFALSVVERSGNLRLAYIDVFGDRKNPTARARDLLTKPGIQDRINQLQTAVQQSCLVSLESHLIELANIRDLAKLSGSLKVALAAEESRGKVSGLYVGKSDAPPPPTDGINSLAKLADRLINLKRGADMGVIDVESREVQSTRE